MTLKAIKEEMINYRDFYGGDLLGESEIMSATSKKQLAHVIERHRHHMEDMLADANRHLDDLKNRVGLSVI